VYFVGLNAHGERPLSPDGTTSVDLVERAPRRLDMGLVAAAGRWLRTFQPDVVQVNGGYALKYVAVATRLHRLQTPIVYRNIGLSSDWLRSSSQRVWVRWLLRAIQASASVSTASRDDLVSTYGLDPRIATVIRRGVPMAAQERAESRRGLRRELGLEEDTPVLIHVGSFSPEKNHVGLLRSMSGVWPSHPRVHLVLVGEGPLKRDIASRSAELGNVHLLGVRTDVPRLLAASDLLLLPSTTEGIPGVILEAGVQSLPVVAYDVGGVAEVVRDGSTGRLIPAGDEAAFGQSVATLLGDPVGRRRLGDSVRSLVESEYSLERSVDSFEELYERVASA